MLLGDPIIFNSVDRPRYNKLLIRPIVKYRGKEKIIRTKAQTRSVAVVARSDTQTELLEATEQCLHRYGLNGLSTRRVAEAARMPLSQIHYHFGSKEDLVLALLAYKNERLLNRQAAMYAQDLPLWKRWKQACDYLDEDLAIGLRARASRNDGGRLVEPGDRQSRAPAPERMVCVANARRRRGG